jgi:transcriptional regulator of acetoin/glycerol metabolism
MKWKKSIINTLKASNGKVSGAGGAAELLGISAQTLYSKIKKHGNIITKAGLSVCTSNIN